MFLYCYIYAWLSRRFSSHRDFFFSTLFIFIFSKRSSQRLSITRRAISRRYLAKRARLTQTSLCVCMYMCALSLQGKPREILLSDDFYVFYLLFFCNKVVINFIFNPLIKVVYHVIRIMKSYLLFPWREKKKPLRSDINHTTARGCYKKPHQKVASALYITLVCVCVCTLYTR